MQNGRAGGRKKKQVTEKTSGNLASQQQRLRNTLLAEIESGLADLGNLYSNLPSFFYDILAI